jgi:regulation of enolase protein 1 (concanavalin A-like superfamily)
MVSTTLRNTSKEVVDNVSDNNALLTFLKKRGNIRTEDGGYEIAIPLEYAENSTTQRYSGFDPLDIGASDVITSAKFDWCQIALHVVASGREIRLNSGENAMIKLAKAKATNAKHTASNFLATDIYSSGASSNQIGGLGLLIGTDGTGTVGGFNSTTYTWWRNQFKEAAGTGTWSKSTIKGEMNALWYTLVRGTDKPDLLVSSHDFYAAYEEALQDNQRYQSSSEASAGFESLKYKSASIIFDSNTNFATTAEKMYFINTKYLYLIQHKQAMWTQDDEKKPVNQDAVVVPMYWMGNLVVSNRSLQGVLIDAA